MLRLLAAGLLALAQQVADRDFRLQVTPPPYAAGKAGGASTRRNHNFHSLDGRFFAFGELLRRDGFLVRASRVPFDAQAMAPRRASDRQPLPDDGTGPAI